MHYLLIGVGGFLGAISRYVSQIYVHKFLPLSFPYGTIFVNVIGCLLIGLFLGVNEKFDILHINYKLFFVVGFLGAFTTFSAFGIETYEMLLAKEFLSAFINVFVSVFLSLIAVFLGFFIIKSI